MKKNVGLIDRILRFILGLFLLWFGLFYMDGTNGNFGGIIIAIASIMPFTMSITASCFVFRWFNINSLTKRDREELKDSV